MTDAQSFWPNGARLAVSVSMQFEAGGQPISGAGGPVTEAVLPGFPDLGQNSFYEYGAREGVPRILDLLDRHSIKMTSFMIGDAVRRHPDVAAEIVRRGHEAGAHGRSWQRQYQLPKLLRTGVPTAADLGQVPAAGVPCGVPSSRSSDCRPRCHSALNDYRLLGLGEITGRHLDEG